MNSLIFIVFSMIHSIPVLTTSNFKGKPPPGAFQSAYTIAQYDYAIIGAGSDTKIEVECWMLQDSSWINWNLPQLNDIAVLNHLLIHEQGHFNLVILFAKKLKKETGKVDLSNPNEEVPRLLKIKEKLNAEASSMNDKYESETRNGRNKNEQSRWNELIEAELFKLENEKVKILFR
jgi:hypothetical protein